VWFAAKSISSNIKVKNGIVGWGNFGFINQVNAFRLASEGEPPCDGNGLVNYWWGHDLYACTNLITINTWHHSIAQFYGTTREIYLDGALIARDVPGSSHNVPNTDNFKFGQTCPVSICYWNEGEWFNGSLHAVRIYNRALSAEEVARLYSTGQ
jgi:hypothetical protein